MAPKRRTMNKRKSHFKNIKNKSRRVRRGGEGSGKEKEEKEINIIKPTNKWRENNQEMADYDIIDNRNKIFSVIGRSLSALFANDSNKNKKDNSVNVDTTSKEEIVNNNPVVHDSMNVSSNRNRGINNQRSRLQKPYLQENPTKREFSYNDPVRQPAPSLINSEINPEKGGRKKRRTMKKEGRKMRK
jgi:hypothetical protein